MERAEKISRTMKRKGIDNFANWRKEARNRGLIPKSYPRLVKNGDLAELVGAILGDGHIEKFPRCEALYLTFHLEDIKLVARYTRLVQKIFGKPPRVTDSKKQRSTRIRLYQKNISNRLNIPTGSRSNYIHRVPNWILSKEDYSIRYLRGLYEAEGSLCFHQKTYTHKFIFSNNNESLLKAVHSLLLKLGFHPSKSYNKVQISKKNEVQNLANLLQFRQY